MIKDLEMRKSNIQISIQLGPKVNDEYPYKRHTEEGHNEEKSV